MIQGKLFKEKYNEVQDDNDSWENTNEDMGIIESCGLKPEEPFIITLSRKVKSKIDFLMKRFPNTEWLAYLTGDKETMIVSDMIIPKQSVSTANVFVIERPVDENIIGVIHSHHGMGAFFSGTDDSYINMNNDMSIVVAHNGYKAIVKWKTPCGHICFIDATVNIEVEKLFCEDKFTQSIEENINVSSHIVTMDDDIEEDDMDVMPLIDEAEDILNEIDSKYDSLRPRPKSNKIYVKGLSIGGGLTEQLRENFEMLKTELKRSGIN